MYFLLLSSLCVYIYIHTYAYNYTNIHLYEYRIRNLVYMVLYTAFLPVESKRLLVLLNSL